jgi:hypothetical protein
MPQFLLLLEQGYCGDTTYVKVLSRESRSASKAMMGRLAWLPAAIVPGHEHAADTSRLLLDEKNEPISC